MAAKKATKNAAEARNYHPQLNDNEALEMIHGAKREVLNELDEYLTRSILYGPSTDKNGFEPKKSVKKNQEMLLAHFWDEISGLIEARNN